MRPEDLALQIRMQIEQERRHGIAYWCDPDLAGALAGFAPGPAAAPGRPAVPTMSAGKRTPSSGTGPKGNAPIPPPLQFAKPPARLVPARSDASADPPAGARPSPAPAAAGSGPRTPAPSEGTPRPATARPAWGPPPKAKGRATDWKEQLGAIEGEARQCRSCTLCETRSNVVFGVGEAHVPLVFVGEAPGADEDRQGYPFVGRAGMLLNKIIEAIGLAREQVYICNVLKCRPPGNRDPLPEEVISCQDYLMRQLAVLKPAVICTLGRHSTHLLAGQMGAMKNHRGQVFEWRGAKVVPTYHPAALLRNPALKPLVWEDVQQVRRLLDAEGNK